MRSHKGSLLLAVVLAVVGLVLVLHGSPSVDYSVPEETGGAYASTLVMEFDNPSTWTSQALLGSGFVWIASLLTAGVVGHWIATRRSPSASASS